MSSNGEQKAKYSFSAPAILPDGNGGFTPCPDLLTEDEAVRFLRLDEVGIEDPAGTLRYYRKKGLLKATQVGKCIRYRRVELENFLAKITEENPRLTSNTACKNLCL